MIALVARSLNNIIGKDGELPWHSPEDLKFFKLMTKGHTIVVGRTTYQSLPPLPNRRIIVLTNNLVDVAELHEGGSIGIINDINLIPDDAIICGGGTVYDQLIHKCSEIYVSTIKGEYEGDTTFKEQWLDGFDIKRTVIDSEDLNVTVYFP